MERVKSRIFAGLAAVALAGGTVTAVATSGQAATPQCTATGYTCVALASQEWGTGYVSAVSGGTAAKGQAIILSAAGEYSAEDFVLLNEGSVSNFCTVDPGIISSAVCATWPSYQTYEYQYSPDGDQSGLCLGTAHTAANGTAVSLRPCGVDAETVWVPLTIDSINGVEPLIAGDDTNVNTPFVLTAGSASADQLITHKLDLVDGTFNPAQMWQPLTGVLGS
jgi:hypothetical protein